MSRTKNYAPDDDPFPIEDDDFAERDYTDDVEVERKGNGIGEQQVIGLGERDAGDDIELPPPRGWLTANIFCRKFISSLLGDGGVGKTATRYAQYLSLVTGRSLTGEHVFQRCRVLIISLEDSIEELQRRILAARLHYGISTEDVRGWLFYTAPGAAAGKLMTTDRNGGTRRGQLAASIEGTIIKHKIDLVAIDPFVKSHGVPENENSLIDDVMQVLTDLANKHDIAFDVPHHTSKGTGTAEPGNANRGRGASAMADAGRLVFTLTIMSGEEAQMFGIDETERKQYVRVDSGKVNIIRGGGNPKWFHLIGVRLGNATELYPNGDEVQTVEGLGAPGSQFTGSRPPRHRCETRRTCCRRCSPCLRRPVRARP